MFLAVDLTRNHYICHVNRTEVNIGECVPKMNFRHHQRLSYETDYKLTTPIIMHLSTRRISHRNIRLLALALCAVVVGHAVAQIDHPTLIYTPSVVGKARQAVGNDSTMAHHWQELQKKTDSFIGSKDLSKAEYLVLAYRMTGQQKYAESLKRMLLDAVKAESWGVPEMLMRTPAWHTELQVAHRSYACAVAYDAIYQILTTGERQTIAKGLQRLAVEPAMADWLTDSTRIHCLNSMGHNWWSSCVCMGGLLALSLENEIPANKNYVAQILDILPEWFSFAGDHLQQKARSFDQNGGQYESLNYANFAIQEPCIFMLAYHQAFPNRKLPDIPQLDQVENYLVHFAYPRNGDLWDLNFGDSHKNITGESSLEMLYALGHSRDKNALWYFSQVVDEQHRDGFFRSRPMGFIYMPETYKAPITPDAPLCELFPDIGIASMRNSWQKDATMLGVKSGVTWNHSHADANSIILFHKGVDLIKDAGNCSYGNANYRNYFFQSQAHNVVLFDGKGQSMEQQYHGAPQRGYLYDLLDGGNIKYIMADGTGPMSDLLNRNFRHYLWWDNVIYIIDDLKSHAPGHFQWLWHPGGTYKKNGSDIEITSGKASLIIRPLYPQILIPSGFLQDYPDALTLEEHEGPTENLDGTEKYISLHLPAQCNQVKGVTAIILKDSTNQHALPLTIRRQGENWIGLRIVSGDKVTDLYINQLADGRLMHSNSWITADGWTTDAYMFGIRYRKGTSPTLSKEMFVCYGSTLKRGDKLYYSSYAKQTFITESASRNLSVLISGQPHPHFKLRAELRPDRLTVNGFKTTCEYADQMCDIRL